MNPNPPQWSAGQTPLSQVAAGNSTTSQISSRPGGPAPAGGNGTDRPITLWGLLDAFRRRWIPTLAVAIPAALLVAGMLWQTIPAEYESTALIKVQQNEDVMLFEDQKRATEFLTFRDSQIAFLKSRHIATAALRVEGVRDCRLLKNMQHPVEWMLEELEVESDLSDEFIRLTLAGEHPEDLALIVNAVKDVYLDEVVFNQRNDRMQRLKKLQETFRERDETVRKNQERIARLADELNTGDPKMALVNMTLLQEKLRLLQTDLEKINNDLRQEEATRAFLKERGLPLNSMARSAPGFSVGTGSAPATTAMDEQSLMHRQLMLLKIKIRQFKSTTRNPQHPDLLAMQAQQKELERLLGGFGESTDGESPVAISRYDWLLKQREKLVADIRMTEEELDLKGARIFELEQEAKEIEHLVATRDELAQKIAELEVELAAPLRVREMQKANVPEKRDIKARVQASVVGGIGTFGLILGGFVMFEWFSHRVGSTSDIANAVNLRLVGTIPSPDKGGLLGLGIFAGKVDYDEWNRAVIESMDVVRTYLMRHIDPSRSASILITSASANEGKTTVSCQLAASLARSGKRVALVDCDFRRPSAHLMLEGNAGPGICEFLRGEANLDQIRQQTQADGLTFIAAGQVDQLVLQKLSVDGGRELIDSLKAEFDFVIIDTSPMLFVAEPSMLAQNADIVLLSTRKDYSRIPYVAQSRDSLRSLQVPLLGAVMVGSDSDFQRQSYGYRQEIQRQAGPQSDIPVGAR